MLRSCAKQAQELISMEGNFFICFVGVLVCSQNPKIIMLTFYGGVLSCVRN